MSFLLRLWGHLPIPPKLRWAMVSLFVPKFAVGVVGVIFNEKNEVLLFHHTYRGKRFPWGLPGGWLDPREDPARGIVREIYEETRLNIRALHPLLIENAIIFRRLDVIFLCEIVDGDFYPSTEVDKMQYFARHDLPPMMLSQRELLEKLFDLTEDGK